MSLSRWGVPEARSALRELGHSDDDDRVQERYARAVWSGLAEPGDGVAGELVRTRGAAAALRSVERAREANGPPADADERLAKGYERWMPRLSASATTDALDAARRASVRLVIPGDPHWPAALDDLDAHAPLMLWVRGATRRLADTRPAVAIVGARASTQYGDRIAGELAQDLVTSDVTIVSGAAYGIDGSAHREALAAEGRTVALLAGGADRAYPLGHTRLLDTIAERGLVVSETPCGSAPTKWRFLRRNRLIAALSHATVVVEAGWRSGSLNTAGHAVELSRGLGAVPGPVTSPASAGCHRLLREYGAQCITSADDVRELLGDTSSIRQPAPGDTRPATDDATRVRDALSVRAWRSVDDIARRSGMSARDAVVNLGLLRATGEVERTADGWRSIRTPR